MSQATDAIDQATAVWSNRAKAFLTALELRQFEIADELRGQAIDGFTAWCDVVAREHRRAADAAVG